MNIIGIIRRLDFDLQVSKSTNKRSCGVLAASNNHA